jgi:hypothetical protein
MIHLWQGYAKPSGYLSRVDEGRGKGTELIPSANPYPWEGPEGRKNHLMRGI